MSNFNSSSHSLWLPATFNQGWTYTKVVKAKDAGKGIVEWLTIYFKHSSFDVWEKRLADEQILLNDEKLVFHQTLRAGDKIAWIRPPWIEASVPSKYETIFDNGDLKVINKPSGLPVLPGGGFLDHTLIGFLNAEYRSCKKNLIPKPIHRLGRCTSGVLLCARKASTRAKISSLLRRSKSKETNFKKIYRALARKNVGLELNRTFELNIPIVEVSHPLLGRLWSAPSLLVKHDLSLNRPREYESLTRIKLIESRKEADLLEIALITGRPHQIRIHLAAIGTPLIGDPLYLEDHHLAETSTPGDGGYLLHAQKYGPIEIDCLDLSFSAEPPDELLTKEERMSKSVRVE